MAIYAVIPLFSVNISIFLKKGLIFCLQYAIIFLAV